MKKQKGNIIFLQKEKGKRKRLRGIRKIIILLPLLSAILMYGFLFMQEATDKIGTHIVAAQNAYLLEKPDIHGNILALVPMNTSFEQYKVDGAYYKVNYDGKKGFLSTNYFVLVQKAEGGYEAIYRDRGYAFWKDSEKAPSQQSYHLKRGVQYTLVSSADTNFRSRADIRSHILHTIPKGDDILYLDGGIQWYRVFHGGEVGYIHISTFTEKKIEQKEEP